MTDSRTLAAAEQEALEGLGDSQDSQAILEAYAAQFGVGIASSSPAATTESRKNIATATHQSVSVELSEPPTRRRSLDRKCRRNPIVSLLNNDASIAVDGAETFARTVEVTARGGGESEPSREQRRTLNTDERSQVVNGRQIVKRTKMEVSQQSPTQANEDDDYERYLQRESSPMTTGPATSPGPTSPSHRRPSQNTAPHEQRTLHEDDIGAVNFGAIYSEDDGGSQLDDVSSVIDPTSFGPRRGAWRNERGSSEQHSSARKNGYSNAPETPAPPRNPFAGNAALAAPLLGPSQLFAQTQLSSAVRKGLSPTSSRPSPNVFPIEITTPFPLSSPLKHRINMTSSPNIPSPNMTSPSTALPNITSPNTTSSNTFPVSSPQALLSTFSNIGADETPAVARISTIVEEAEEGTPQIEPDVTAIPESPVQKPRDSGRELIGEYEPMQESQARKAPKSDGREAREPDSDMMDSDDELRDRKRRARLKREEAARQMAAISFRRPDRQEVRSRAGRNGRALSVQLSNTVRQDQSPMPAALEETITDSQGRTDSSRPTPSVQSPQPVDATTDGSKPTSEKPAADNWDEEHHTAKSVTLGHGQAPPDVVIPETSPAPRGSDTSYPGRQAQSATSSSEDVSETTHTLPTPATAAMASTRRNLRKYSTRGRSSRTSPKQTKGANTVAAAEENDKARMASIPQPPTVVYMERSSSPPAAAPHQAKRRRIQRAEIPPSEFTVETPMAKGTADPMTSSTAMSHSGSTPSHSTPGTQPSGSSSAVKSRHHAEPKTAQVDKPKSSYVRSSRRSRSSPDELAMSPSLLEVGDTTNTASTNAGLSIEDRDASNKASTRPLFHGMIFAISFLAERQGESKNQYSKRLSRAADVEENIKENGGRVLQGGFDELFDFAGVKRGAPAEHGDRQVLTMTDEAKSLGFAAVIADGHSRKAKYMQALALGLPCISDTWITDCVFRGELIPWTSYLLCAGESTFLHGAIRSRVLEPYDASKARFEKVIAQRNKLLEDESILLVMKKTRAESTTMAYSFLAHVLGATQTRVNSLDEARHLISNKSTSEHAFDWIYVDPATGKYETLLSEVDDKTQTASKKRKRGSSVRARDKESSAASVLIGQAGEKKNKKLTSEILVQSLIIDCMINDGEIDD